MGVDARSLSLWEYEAVLSEWNRMESGDTSLSADDKSNIRERMARLKSPENARLLH